MKERDTAVAEIMKVDSDVSPGRVKIEGEIDTLPTCAERRIAKTKGLISRACRTTFGRRVAERRTTLCVPNRAYILSRVIHANSVCEKLERLRRLARPAKYTRERMAVFFLAESLRCV